MAIILKPPVKLDLDASKLKIFLAGSIEMGVAIDWQSKFEQELNDFDVVILNPRRESWDASWQQSIDNDQFREQVEWELTAQEEADIIAMYFVPETKSPITLLELGLFAQSKKLIVCCPEGFWRKGNVDIVCHRYGIEMADNLADLINKVKEIIEKRLN